MSPRPINEVQEEAQSQIDDLQSEIVEIVSEEEGMAWTNNELAEELGVNRQRVSRVTKELRENDELNALRAGRSFYYFVGEADFTDNGPDGPSTTESQAASPTGSSVGS